MVRMKIRGLEISKRIGCPTCLKVNPCLKGLEYLARIKNPESLSSYSSEECA